MHSLIVGMTESGKTLLSKCFIKIFNQKGINSLVLDPMQDPEFNATYQTSNPDEFLQMVFLSRSCHVYVDETGDAIGHYNPTMQTLATKGRHNGHSCFFISQSVVQMPPIIRGQSSQIYLFATDNDGCKRIANEYNSKNFMEGTKLKQGEFLHKTRFGKITKGNVFEIAKRINL